MLVIKTCFFNITFFTHSFCKTNRDQRSIEAERKKKEKVDFATRTDSAAAVLKNKMYIEM
jgi:hypothetical protein